MRSKLFRADKRSFKVGDPIYSARQFTKLHQGDARKVEDVLRVARPKGKPRRKGCLMVFDSEACARDYWCKMSGGRLYQVRIGRRSVLHKGDMKLLKSIENGLKAGQRVDDLVSAYWRGSMTENSCAELLVPCATIVAEIGSEAERLEHFKKLAGIRKYNPATDDADLDAIILGPRA